MDTQELADWLRLTLTPGIGPQSSRKLLAAFGLPSAIFAQSVSALQQVVSPAQAEALRQVPPELAALIDRTARWLDAPAAALTDPQIGRRVVSLGDPAYPACLLELEDPPLMLYLMGRLDLPHSAARSLAMVGSRNPTAQGKLNAQQFARALCEAGLTIVSGLALGIDGAAHAGALEGLSAGSPRLATIAVVGTGLDRVYPKSHLALAHRIAQQGLLISEYPIGTPPLAANFPRRNRLIAGLSCGTLVVEAALQSGSLITARLAAEQGREVFAIPGSIHAAQSRGCHALIRQGAKLVESAQDVLEDLAPVSGLPLDSGTLSRSSQDAPANLAAESELLQALGFDPVGLDALQARTGLDTATLQAALMTLEIDGLLTRLPGGLFQRLTRA